MATLASGPTASTAPNQPALPSDLGIADKVKEAWDKRCSHLSDEERMRFNSFACADMTGYTKELSVLCQNHKDEKTLNKVTTKWFEPLFHAVGLFIPTTAISIQAYPNPGSLILGAIVLVLDTTKRVQDYQKLTIQMLSRMGRKSEVIAAYEKEVYKDDLIVQLSLVELCGSILDFCCKAVRQFDRKGKLQAKVKGVVLSIFRDFSAYLSEEVKKFEDAMDDLELKALLCDKRRLQKLQQNQTVQQQVMHDQSVAKSQRLDDIHEIQLKLWERQNNIDASKCSKSSCGCR
ncbi:hypothetical protein BT63DRAFT_294457 [Microthyrium microscopicum]|uniref:Fungal STAND N-terminal Goodbye domain-containing protein n=1 Tax=Microthyrium microscopicum TaxID=703497 RepID=A0A6A6U5V6_9PEZI|nr:hypothetical protein BT63DRAFT_294457 [Microthyrium microscopicum]